MFSADNPRFISEADYYAMDRDRDMRDYYRDYDLFSDYNFLDDWDVNESDSSENPLHASRRTYRESFEIDGSVVMLAIKAFDDCYPFAAEYKNLHFVGRLWSRGEADDHPGFGLEVYEGAKSDPSIYEDDNGYEFDASPGDHAPILSVTDAKQIITANLQAFIYDLERENVAWDRNGTLAGVSSQWQWLERVIAAAC